jgi:hypothetical protein
MKPAHRSALLIVIGVAVFVLSIIVLWRNSSPDDEMLATVALLGGAAIVVVALPRNGNGS